MSCPYYLKPFVHVAAQKLQAPFIDFGPMEALQPSYPRLIVHLRRLDNRTVPVLYS
jgi:hypothetical protein